MKGLDRGARLLQPRGAVVVWACGERDGENRYGRSRGTAWLKSEGVREEFGARQSDGARRRRQFSRSSEALATWTHGAAHGSEGTGASGRPADASRGFRTVVIGCGVVGAGKDLMAWLR